MVSGEGLSVLWPSHTCRGMNRGIGMAKRLDSAVAIRNVKTPGRHPAGDTLYLMVWPSARKS